MGPPGFDLRRAAAATLLAGFSTACGAGQPPHRQARAASVDANRTEAEHFVTALSSGNADGAERRFSAELRSKLPPARLASTWRSLVAQNGAFQSYGVVHEDNAYAKERYTLELDFAERPMLALLVFEPKNGEVIGLFFAKPPGGEQPASTPPADPAVVELTLAVGAPPTALGASLTLPRARQEARLPAVLLVGGSGPHDRDETLGQAKPLRDIAYGLARRGVVALRYDKRTFAYPHADFGHGTVEEEVLADAVAAARMLEARPEVDRARTVVIGHSLGALLAPEIAQRSGGIAGLVLLAAPARAVPESMIEQLRLRGVSEATLAPLEAKARAIPELPPDEIVLGVTARYWQDLARRDEIRIARELGVPILYLRGELDQNVFAADQERWTSALGANGRFEAVTLPGLNHLFLPAGAKPGDPNLHVDEQVVTRIADFITSLPDTPGHAPAP